MGPVKKCCKFYHFLAKYLRINTGETYKFSWDAKERSNLTIKGRYAAECYKGVWSTGVDPKLNTQLTEILSKDRSGECFFIEAHEGMLFPAADELFRIRHDNRQLRISYRYTQIALGVAAVGIIANFIYQVL